MFHFYPHNSLHEAATRLQKSVAMREEHDRIRDAQTAVNDLVSALYFFRQAGVDTSEAIDLKALHDAVTNMQDAVEKTVDEADLVPLLKVDLSEVEALMVEGK